MKVDENTSALFIPSGEDLYHERQKKTFLHFLSQKV